MNARWRCFTKWRKSGVTCGLSRLLQDDLIIGIYKFNKYMIDE